jgi:hypothetical protein
VVGSWPGVFLKIESWEGAKSSTVKETRYEIPRGPYGFDGFLGQIWAPEWDLVLGKLRSLQTVARKSAEHKLEQWAVPEVRWGNRATALSQDRTFVSGKWNGNTNYWLVSLYVQQEITNLLSKQTTVFFISNGYMFRMNNPSSIWYKTYCNCR